MPRLPVSFSYSRASSPLALHVPAAASMFLPSRRWRRRALSSAEISANSSPNTLTSRLREDLLVGEGHEGIQKSHCCSATVSSMLFLMFSA